MKFTCHKTVLAEYLGIAKAAIPTKTSMPILECVLITANENGLKMTAYNMEMGIKTSNIPSIIDEGGNVAVPGIQFNNIINKMPDGDITVTVDKSNDVVTISSGRTVLTISGQSGDDYPDFPQFDLVGLNTIASTVLKSMIKQTMVCASSDRSKPVFMGAGMELGEGRLILSSCDGYKIANRQEEATISQVGAKAIIPLPALTELNKILSNNVEHKVNINITERQVIFEQDKFTFLTNRIEGEMPDYNKFLNVDTKLTVHVEIKPFMQSLERVLLFSEGTMQSPATFKIDGNTMDISTKSEKGLLNDTLPASISGDSLTISFRANYILDILKTYEHEEAVLNFGSPLTPCLITPYGADNYKSLVLPVRPIG